MNRINELRACLMIGVAAAACTVSSGQALAQAAGEGGEGRLEEIVVTAQKREQNVQDIPIAVTAISQGQIAANRINTVQDLSGLAPNMTVRPASGGLGTPAFSMRGAISYGTVPGSDKEVGIYLDGVYLSGSKASIFDIPDIERIEVLRGPQGTLFGRNATAGAVSFTTRDPKGEFGVTLEATVGNYAQRRYRASVDLPAWGPFSAYVSFVHSERRGDIKNLGAGTVWDRTGPDSDLGVLVSPEYLGDRDVNSLFVAVKFEPSDNFSTVYKFDRTVDHFTPEGMPLIAYDGTAGATGAPLDALFKNSPNQFVAGLAQRPTVANNSWVVPGVQRNSGHSLTSELRLSDSISLKNIAAYRKSYVFGASQIGGMGGLVVTPGAVAAVPSLAPLLGNRFVDIATHRVVTSEQWSEELQLNYNSRLLTLTLGGIYFHSKDREGGPPFMRGTFSFFSAIPASGQLPLGRRGRGVQQGNIAGRLWPGRSPRYTANRSGRRHPHHQRQEVRNFLQRRHLRAVHARLAHIRDDNRPDRDLVHLRQFQALVLPWGKLQAD